MLIFQTALSFVAGGLLIATQTIVAERVALRWRGIVLTVPTTMALGFLFIGFTKSVYDIKEVAVFFPAALVVSYAFVCVFAFLSRISRCVSMAGALLGWCVVARIILRFPPSNFITSTFAYAAPAIALAYALVRTLPQVTEIVPVPITKKLLLTRSLIGGSIIACAVILANTLGNIWGSLFSAFPAAFASTFFIYYAAHGKTIIPSVAKSLFFPGIIGYIFYALVAGITFPRWGIWYGTLASYAVTLGFYWLYGVVSVQKKERNIQNRNRPPPVGGCETVFCCLTNLSLSLLKWVR